MKKFHLHADALICIVLLIILSLAGNLFLFWEMRRLGTENVQMQIQAKLDYLNLASLKESLAACQERAADPYGP